jgi:tetratricopeptide (TPR) repeat protein
MSGAATFSGTNYQAGVIAFVYAHILKQAPLAWFEHFIDTPLAISGETDGPGDDARIEFGSRHPAIEVQAKHGFTAGAKLSEFIADVRTRSHGDTQTRIVLVVDRTSSRAVRIDVPLDLDRYRSGRGERLRNDVKAIIDTLGADAALLNRLYVATVDVDRAADAERRFATHLLEDALVDSSQAAAAWDVLYQDASQLCAKRLRRSRQDIVDLLAAKGMAVRPPEKDEAVMQQLDLSRRLLAQEKGSLAFSLLGMIEADAKGTDVSSRVWYRIRQHRAAALLLLRRAAEALVSAQQALDIDPNGIHALLTATQAAIELGDLAMAQGFLDRGLRIDGDSAEVWSIKVQVDAMQGLPATDPPSGVVASDGYQLALAQIAMNVGKWPEVVSITNYLVACGKGSPKILLLLATAQAALSQQEAAEERRAEAEQLATDALEGIGDDHPLAVRFLVLRADLRRARGDELGGEQDLERARDLNDRDPDTLARLAQAQLHAGKAEYALQTLSVRETEENPMLLIVRARARIRLNDDTRARQDLDAAVAHAEDADDPDACRVYAAETALQVKDIELAERLLDGITNAAVAPEMRAALRGRIAFERRDPATMEAAFRDAAAIAPGIKAKLFSELAQRLLRLDHAREAVTIFEEIGLEALPSELHGDYAGALMVSNELVKAAKIVGDAMTSTAPPEWALRIAAEIAVRQGDVKHALELLARVAALHPDDLVVAFELARRLLLMREPQAATAYIDALVAQAGTLDPPRKLAVAHLLKEAGRRDEAITLGFAAYRAAPQDAAIHRAFGDLLLRDPRPIHHPGVVTADTYVKLTSDNGDEREYVIYAGPPIDPRSHEMLLAQAESAGYVGKRVGDVIVQHAGTWQEQRWTVAEILPAVVYVFRDIMTEYEKRFEGEPFYVQTFKMSEQPSVKDFSPIVSQLHARRTLAEDVFKVYRDDILPLGFAASMLGIGVADVMAGAMTEELGPLAVEWFDIEGHEASRAVARAASDVVLTRSGIETLFDLKLLDLVRAQFTLIAPHSLLDALEREVLNAEEHCANGQRALWSGDTGFRADEVPAEHPTLRAKVERARAIFEWMRANVRAEFRPLETIAPPESEEEQARQMIGHDSMDAVQLTQHLGITMLADDLGLRRFVPKGGRGHTMSTIWLISALAERKAISTFERDRLLLRLIERRYVVILPTRSLLVAALHPSVQSPTLARETFGLLGGPALDLPSAAKIAAEVLRDTLLAPLQLAGVAHVVKLVLDGMARRWSPNICAYALANATATQLALMPTQLKDVRDAITAYVKRSGPAL